MLRRFTSLSCCVLLMTAVLGLSMSLSAQTFSNAASISIPALGNASPYPSTIEVSGGPASVGSVSVTISGISHTWPSDVDILLAGPTGAAMTIVSDCGTGTDWVGANLVITDLAPAGMVNTALNPTGSYKPTDFVAGDVFPTAPAFLAAQPAGSATLTSVFSGTDANGIWSLYIVDDTSGDSGSISGGWSITFSNEVPGCTDPGAVNYDPDATFDDGSCISCPEGQQPLIISMFDSADDGWNGSSYTIINTDGDVVATGNLTFAEGGSGQDIICLPPGCYAISLNAGSWPGEVGWTLGTWDGDEILSGGAPFALTAFSWQTPSCGTAGCMDMNATNYDPAAIFDNGACLYCNPGETVLRFVMIDSWGDGWNGAGYFISNSGGTVVANGTLASGAEEVDNICFAAGCYSVTVTEGGFPEEVSWQILDGQNNIVLEGGPGVADIGFSWGGADCTIEGCTNPDCFNYNPSATDDDGSCECPVENDDCVDATDIGCGVTVNGTTNNASAETNSPPACYGMNTTSPGVWYRMIGTGDQITASTCPSSPDGTITDTKIIVYSGNCSALSCVGASDDYPGCTLFKSQVTFSSVAGQTYYIYVGEWGPGEGIDFALSITCESCDDIPVNDVCANALPQPDGIPTPINLCCANQDRTLSNLIAGNGVWLTMNSGDADSFDFELVNGTAQGADANDGENVGMIIYTGTCGNLTPLAQCPVVPDVCAGSLSSIGIAIQPNTDYYFLVYTTYPTECGQASLTTSFVYIGCTDPFADNYDPQANEDDGSCEYTSVPENDLCAGAIPLDCNSTVDGTTGASTNTDAPIVCGVGGGDEGVWYSFEGDGQIHTLYTCGSPIDSRISVLSSENGCDGPFDCVIAEDDDPSNDGCGFFDGDDASVTFISEIGVTYFIYISAGEVDTNGDGEADLFDGSFIFDFVCEAIVEGCTDPCACNYDPLANVSTDVCDYFSCADCGPDAEPIMFFMNDTFGDGWNNATYTITQLGVGVVASGSLDEGQCTVEEDNFTGPESGFDILCLGAGCYVLEVGGGDWDGEIEWELFGQDGNSIEAGEAGEFNFYLGGAYCGCTDPGACNYDAGAAADDGSCEYNSCAGCMDEEACNYDPEATISQPSQCCYDNCVTLLMTDSANDGWNGSSAVITSLATGEIIGTATLQSGASGSASFCLPSGCYSITVSSGSWPGEVGWTLLGVNGLVTGGAPANGVQFTTGDGNCTPGCTEPFACNYDPEAGLSDCTLCEYTPARDARIRRRPTTIRMR
jgi:hypothetical protein